MKGFARYATLWAVAMGLLCYVAAAGCLLARPSLVVGIWPTLFLLGAVSSAAIAAVIYRV